MPIYQLRCLFAYWLLASLALEFYVFFIFDTSDTHPPAVVERHAFSFVTGFA